MNDYKRFFLGFTLIILLGTFWGCAPKQSENSSLKIGLAEVSYNPPVGADLVGNYRGNDYASRGIHDSLYSRAMVVENGKGEKVAFLTVDICKLPKESVTMMRSYISSNTKIKAENILIHAIHTHSGPKSDLDAPHAVEYLTRAASAVIGADKVLKPGRFLLGRTQESSVSFNRRLQGKDGKIHMSWEHLNPDSIQGPLGETDPEVIVLGIEQEGKLSGALINFGCHATTLTGNNWLYTADYPGYLIRGLKKAKGEKFIPMFFNGCCGNVTQVDYKKGFIDTYEECERIGNVLASASMKAMNNMQKIPGSAIVVSKEMVPLKRMTISEDQYKWAQKMMKKIEKEGMPPFQPDGIPDAQYAKQWMEMYNTQNLTDSLEVMTVKIGDLAIVGMPGEMFCEFGKDIKQKSAFTNTIVIELANDARKYFPTSASFDQGPGGYTPMISGYETTPGTTLYDRGSGEKLTESALNQLTKLKNE